MITPKDIRHFRICYSIIFISEGDDDDDDDDDYGGGGGDDDDDDGGVVRGLSKFSRSNFRLDNSK